MTEKARMGIVALCITGALVVMLAIGGFMVHTHGKTKGVDASRPRAAAPARSPDGLPYPECPAVLDWLKNHLNDPDSLRDVKWVERRDLGVYGIRLEVTFRCKNQYGGLQLEKFLFFFKGGELSQAMNQKDLNNMVREWTRLP